MISNNYRWALLLSVIFVGACSSGEDQASKEPILKSQIQAMEKAKNVEQMLQRDLDERMKSKDY